MNAPHEVRLADVLQAVALAVDLGLGQPMGHVARSCLLARRLGREAGLPAGQQDHLYHLTLMGWVGCIADSHQAADWFGDDIAYRAGVYDLDMRPLPFLGYLLQRVGQDDPPHRRVVRAGALLGTGARQVQDSLRAHCQVTEQVARRLGLPEEVCTALRQVFARWDGQGLPQGVRGDEMELIVRLWQLADVAEAHLARGGVAAAVEVVRSRRGTQFDPELVDLFCDRADAMCAALPTDVGATWDEMADAPPARTNPLTGAELDTVLETVADWVDLKSPYFVGHSRAVADLAGGAAARLGLARTEIDLVRRAGLVHDIGRLGVPNTIWDKPGPLTTTEAERVRLHSYYTERVLAQPPALAAIGIVAGSAHERLDGSGYHRSRAAASQPTTTRVLAAADCYRTSVEERPHRRAAAADSAAAALRGHARGGRLDHDAVEAVLACAGHRVGAPSRPAGLTRREQQVLCLVAHGLTNRQVARQLGITPKTVGNHIEHIYAKADVGTRAAATLYAMEHGLL